jgi:hypothetical protein
MNPIIDEISAVRPLLITLGLDKNERVITIIKDNPEYVSRLTNLFNNIINYNIPLTDSTYKAISQNITKTGEASYLLKFLYDLNIDPSLLLLERNCSRPSLADGKGAQAITLELIFKAAYSSLLSLRAGVEQLKSRNLLNTSSLNLMLTHSEAADIIPDLLCHLQNRAYALPPIEKKLTECTSSNMYYIVKLLDFIVHEQLFSESALNFILRHEAYIHDIDEGAKRLADKNKLSANYFNMIEPHPENAVIIVKIMLLLADTQLVNYQNPDDLVKLSQFTLGVFLFLKLLKEATLLNTHSYEIVCRKYLRLEDESVVNALRSIRLFDKLSKSELTSLLNTLQTSENHDEIADEFINTVDAHNNPPKNNSFKN